MLRITLFFIALTGVLLTSCQDEKEKIALLEKQTERLYGFKLDSFLVKEKNIKPSQYFPDLLSPYGVDYPTVDKLVSIGKSQGFSFRKMQAGKPYTLFLSKDSVPKAKMLVYEMNAVDYVVFDLRDTIAVYLRKKESITETHTASGIIDGSLYLTMTDKCLNPVLANSLAEVYAWTIDFYRIQKGDKFKVVYEETTVNGESVSVGRIKSAMFSHKGEKHYAIYFEQNGHGAYYDDENRGLKNQFLKSPVKFSRISSRYTGKRFHPVQKRWKAHLGTDYAAPTGTPIMSTAGGTVVDAKYNKFNGNYVKVKHDRTYTTQYLHMSKIKMGIKRGVRVNQGEVLGYVGSTGLATGPHVCYRFWKSGKQVDALKLKLPKSNPISSKNKAAFEAVKDEALSQMKKIKY